MTFGKDWLLHFEVLLLLTDILLPNILVQVWGGGGSNRKFKITLTLLDWITGDLDK